MRNGRFSSILADMLAMDIPDLARQAMLWDTPLALFRQWGGEWMAGGGE